MIFADTLKGIIWHFYGIGSPYWLDNLVLPVDLVLTLGLVYLSWKSGKWIVSLFKKGADHVKRT
jgi:hypothetical protein